MRKITSIVMILILISMLFGGCNSQNGEDELIKIKVGYHTNYGGAGAVLIGVEKGYFEEQGLEVELIAYSSGPPEISALNSGSIDFAYIGQGSHYLVINGMAEVVCTQNISNAEAIITNSSFGITSLEDLEGKTIAAMLGTSSEDTVVVALASVGLSEDDVNIVNYDMEGAISALMSGMVDAVCVWEEYRFDAIEKLGDNALVLATTGDFIDTYVPLSSWVVSEEYLEDNEEIVQKFVNAIVKSQNYWAYNTSYTCKLISEELGINYANLLLGQDSNDIFSVKELSEYLENEYITELYQMQNDYLTEMYPYLSKTAVDEYLHLEFMQNAVDLLS